MFQKDSKTGKFLYKQMMVTEKIKVDVISSCKLGRIRAPFMEYLIENV